ncbi:hypothetical protein SAMN05443428_109109 [Caloramator quimbayensis]|uniref:Uncharacterized protein n=1 Tax=Caloramator quimbayensis TaxID=1147123 RepID=A0A1T4XJI9_9CLOT|nr:hypothetical protein [Caloramator quimbayensis]SKA89328.1 hypothetical protein SAMN05443428_109109 [Caloramator quimbayensis]
MISKKGILKIISIIILLTAAFFLFLFIKVHNSYATIIYLNWSVKLPKPYKEIYRIDSGSSFHGDGQRYHIFEYKNKNDIQNKLNWKDTKNPEIESEINSVLDRLNVEEIKRPDFDKKYKYYFKIKEDHSKIYLIFYDDIGKLYIIEDIF